MNLKQRAAHKALEYVQSGMKLGLGTGSTTAYFVEMLGKKLQRGDLSDICAVPTSQKTAAQAEKLNIPLTTLAQTPRLDLAVDGADEVDPQLNLIKGLGKALLREKLVEVHAQRLVIIVDESKLVSQLGSRGPLPVEMVPFEAGATVNWLNTLKCQAVWWMEDDGKPAVTDNGNYLALCWFENGIDDPHALAQQLANRPGVVEHGLFLEMASAVVVASQQDLWVME